MLGVDCLENQADNQLHELKRAPGIIKATQSG